MAVSDSQYFFNLEERNIDKRSKTSPASFFLSICILKGRTTTQEQFERFLDSIQDAIESYRKEGDQLINIELFFMIDTPEAIHSLREFASEVRKFSNAPLIYCLNRNSDAGDLRNEFISSLEQLEEMTMQHYFDISGSCNSFFGFMDGDDQVNPQFFTNLELAMFASKNKSKKLILINPASVYSDNGLTDRYPLKWVSNARNAIKEGRSLTDLALEDVIGGQAWGKYYSFTLLKSGARFGKGLYEDVPFWYQICSNIKDWEEVQLVPGAIYLWRRDNNQSLTRVTPDWGSFCHAFDNLEKACEISVDNLKIKSSDKRVWKRYTTGILNLFRNAEKVEDLSLRHEFITKLVSRINLEYFKLKELAVEEPDYIRRVKETSPDYDTVLGPYM